MASKSKKVGPKVRKQMTTKIPKPLLKKLSGNLREARVHCGLSASAVADSLGASKGYVYQLESGTFAPSLSVILRLRRIYRLKTLKELLAGL